MLRRVQAEENEFRAWQASETQKGRDFTRNPWTLQERSQFPTGALCDLEAWDQQVLQIIPAPADMIVRRTYRCVGEAEKTVEDHPVVCLALQRDGSVVPMEVDPECGIIASNDPLVAMSDEHVAYLINGKSVAEGKAIT